MNNQNTYQDTNQNVNQDANPYQGRNPQTYGQPTYNAGGYRQYAYNRNNYGMQGYQAVTQTETKDEPAPAKKEKKKTGTGKRILLVALSALLFGAIAGGVMFGVNRAAGHIWGSSNQTAAGGQSIVSGQPLASSNGNSNVISNPNNSTPGNQPIVPATQPAVGTTGGIIVSDVSDVAAMCMPSVVKIINNFTNRYTQFGQSYSEDAQASGTGIIIGQSETELLIVTNYHVIADSKRLDVTFIDEETVTANVKGYDEDMDIAVIAIQLSSMSDKTIQSIAIAILGDSDSLRVGEPAIAIGNALGYGQSVTLGVISALNREVVIGGVKHILIQTDAAINPGNSGGALVNTRGEVVGINSSKVGGSSVEGMGYAIPITLVKNLIEELSLKETLIKVEEGQEGYLGIYGMNVTDEVSQMYDMPRGAYISQVIDGGAAEAAGLMRGDIIIAMEDKPVTCMEDLTGYLQYYPAGTTVSVTFMRRENGVYVQYKVQLTLGHKF